jgi:hypothetical protein
MSHDELVDLLNEATEDVSPEQFLAALSYVCNRRASVWKGRCEGDRTWYPLWRLVEQELKPSHEHA